MSALRLVAAELRKTATLPAAWVAAAVAGLGSTGLTLLNAVATRDAVTSGHPERVADTSPLETALSAGPLVAVGAVVLGVVAVSSEYTAHTSDAGGGRQITATLTAVPRRSAVLTAKAVAVALLVLATAAVTLPACLAVAQRVIGDAATADDPAEAVARCAGLALYCALTALLAVALTVFARRGIVPLVLLITNCSLVSVSLLLLAVTPHARYLPDVAGIGLFERDPVLLDGLLGARTGGPVMAAWAVGLLVVAAVVLTRRDA